MAKDKLDILVVTQIGVNEMSLKCKKSGFTIVELLTVLVIISLLTAVLLPSLNMVRNLARTTKQRAQFATIDMALMNFKSDSDYGDYPPQPESGDYCGAQILAEALVGWDMLGFHPESAWQADGIAIYETTDDNLDQRKGPYLDIATANVFRLGTSAPGEPDGLFDNLTPPAANTFVICDSFGAKKISLGSGTNVTVIKAGTPILYYKANTSSNMMGDVEYEFRRYDVTDNEFLYSMGHLTKPAKQHLLITYPDSFYNSDYKIINPKITSKVWPYRPDSYILISAGPDGLYGTGDDITNFGN